MDHTSIGENAVRNSTKDDQELIRRLVNDSFSVDEYRNNNPIYDTGDFPSVEIALDKIKEYIEQQQDQSSQIIIQRKFVQVQKKKMQISGQPVLDLQNEN